jgi:hypothetical protein
VIVVGVVVVLVLVEVVSLVELMGWRDKVTRI